MTLADILGKIFFVLAAASINYMLFSGFLGLFFSLDSEKKLKIDFKNDN